MIDAVRYLVDNGIKWRAMPADFPPWPQVYPFFARWRDPGLVTELVVDSQSVRADATVALDSRGLDAGKKINGRKRHLLTDTLGLLLIVLDDFRGLYYDTALSSSSAALPTLLALARPGHVLFGSDWPFAPAIASQYFANGLDSGVDPGVLQAVNRTHAETLFPRPAPMCLRQAAQRAAARLVFKLVQPGTD